MSSLTNRLRTLQLNCLPFLLAIAPCHGLGAQQPAPGPSAPTAGVAEQANPYNLEPFHADYPAELEYPRMLGLEYGRTRRQALQRLAANLQGNVSRESWLTATEFFRRAPEDAVDPLVEAMDRAMGDSALGDVVRNCVEAMGKMASDEFDEALRRALGHKRPQVRQAAYLALAHSSTLKTLRQLRADFVEMDGRARPAWIRAVRVRLPDERVAIYQDLLSSGYPKVVLEEVIKEARLMPASEAAEVLRTQWSTSVGEMRAILAGVLHAAGDAAGTTWLRAAMASEDLKMMELAIKHCIFGTGDADEIIGDLRPSLLAASTHLRPEVRLAAATAMRRLAGDDIADIYEVMSSTEEIWEIRSLAIRELTRRGRSQLVSVMLEELATATGTRLKALVNQLAASGDGRAVAPLVERYNKAADEDSRPFLQAIAYNASDEAAQALCDILKGPERNLGGTAERPRTTRSYVPLLLLNLRGSERIVLEAFRQLPKADWQLRALLLPTIAGYAVDRRDQQELSDACIALVREILFDREEAPQLRVQALNLLTRKWLSVDDAMKLKKMRYEEQPGLRALFADFLNQYF